jgi:hypothetical protein
VAPGPSRLVLSTDPVELLSALKPQDCVGASWVVGRGDLVGVGVRGGEGGDGFHVFAGGGVGEHVLKVV